MTEKPILCIFHSVDGVSAHCDDGFAAAWCVRAALGDDVEFYPGVYQKDPPDVTGRDVLMVDFSYKRPVIEEMRKRANSILILDHHATAKDDLKDCYVAPDWKTWREIVNRFPVSSSVRCVVRFDMARSGAGLTWDYLNGGNRPAFIDYIEDRDLWRKSLAGGDEFTIALRSYPQDFKVWDRLVREGPLPLITEGKTIMRYYRLRVEELKRSAYLGSIDGIPCSIANAPYFAASEVAGELAERDAEFARFGACYFEVERDRWQYSLRSRDDFDVSEVAKKFGGGGHKGAAGFTVNLPVHSPL